MSLIKYTTLPRKTKIFTYLNKGKTINEYYGNVLAELLKRTHIIDNEFLKEQNMK